VIREYTIESDKIKDGIDLAVMADLHNKQYGVDNEKHPVYVTDMTLGTIYNKFGLGTPASDMNYKIYTKIFSLYYFDFIGDTYG